MGVMTLLSVVIALCMILGPFAWALVRCGALADRRYDEQIDKERERVRRALVAVPSRLDYGKAGLRTAPQPLTRIPPRANDERTHGTFSTSWSLGAEGGARGVASPRTAPARPFRPGLAK